MCSGISSLGRATRPSGKSGKSRTSAMARAYPSGAVEPRAPARRTLDDADRHRLVPARPARARPPRAHGRPSRGRARRPRVRARPPPARRGPVPVRNRAWFLLASLRELREALRERGGELWVRSGRPESVLPRARARGRRRRRALRLRRVAVRDGPRPAGRAGAGRRRVSRAATRATSSPTSASRRRRTAARTRSSRRSGARGRRCRGATSHGAPRACACPPALPVGAIPTGPAPEADDPFAPGESAARERLRRWLGDGIERYADRHDRLAGGTSQLSPYLHFGCVSAREVEARARDKGGKGAEAFVRQLAWRDFYAHVLLHHPDNARHAHKRRFDALEWEDDAHALDAWRDGRTGYPVVDAGMRQLRAQGWMHNRARLIVASFLTKDLHLDWRLRRGALHAPPAVRRRGPEQRQLAVDHVGRGRPRAVLPPPLQPDGAAASATTRTGRTCGAGAPSCATCRWSGSRRRGR